MSDSFDYDIVCIGSGPAGQRAAVQAAKLGRRVALIERRGTLGGMCVDSGTIPSKTFREAVMWLAASSAAASAASATHTPQRRPTSAELLARVDEVRSREASIISKQLTRNGVDVFCGEASFVDPHRVRVASDGQARDISSATILIATGTAAVPPAGIAPDGESIMTSDDIGSMQRLPRSLAVVGAGVIGIEYASMFAAIGVDVTVVDRRDRPLEFIDAEIVDELLHQMRKQNVHFRFGEAVDRLEISEGPPRRAVLLLESGKRIVADMALFSVGRAGATGTLGLENVGLTADDRGRVKVDDQFRTVVPNIFAAGDVIGYPSLAATSSEQGRLAACHALGVPAAAMASHFPIGICRARDLDGRRDRARAHEGEGSL
jgi:NAD(P) transhydrogenase